MLKRHTQSGFTLIETTIVLAISSLLVAMVFNGQRQLRETAQLADAIEGVKNSLVTIKNEANNSVNDSTDPTRGADPAGRTVFGRMVQFSAGSDVATVTTLTINRELTAVQQQGSATTRIPWGVTFAPAGPVTSQYIIFTRDPNTGRLRTYAPVNWSAADIQNLSNYNASVQTTADVRFVDPAGRVATVTVNPATGSITRVIQ